MTVRRVLLCASLLLAAMACAPQDTTATGTATRDTAIGADSSSTTVGGTTTGVPVPPPPYEVTSTVLDLADTSRPTPNGASTPASDQRLLPTTVWYPTAAASGGPPDGARFPLVVFGHGLSGHPDKFSQLFGAWAAAGYVVAAPAFPLTNATIANSWENYTDVANQPDDLHFVTDHMLDLAATPGDPIGDRIDPELLGLGGLSLGGATAYIAGLNEASRDPRVDAGMVLAGVAGNDPETDTFLEPSGVPAFLMHGDADPVASPDIPENAYSLLAPPKYLVWLHGGGHAEPFEDAETPYDDFVEQVTTTFWDAYLPPDPAAQARLITEIEAYDQATLLHE